MNTETKKEILKLGTDRAFPMICTIVADNKTFYLINNNAAMIINNVTFLPYSFSFTPPAQESSEDSSTLTIDDTELELRAALMIASSMNISIGIIDEHLPTIYMDGPYNYEVENKSFHQDGKISLNLSSLSMLNYNVSRYTYTNITFPGLF